LAKKESKGKSQIDRQLRFGRFLHFTTDVVNAEFVPSGLTEGAFRNLWEQTDKNEGNERVRFQAVEDIKPKPRAPAA